jgi:hypothetical protein
VFASPEGSHVITAAFVPDRLDLTSLASLSSGKRYRVVTTVSAPPGNLVGTPRTVGIPIR